MQLPSLILELNHQNLTLVLHTSRILSDDWESKSKIIIERIELDVFVEEQRKNFDHYNSKFGQQDGVAYNSLTFSSIGRALVIKSFTEKEDLIKYKDYLWKKRVLRPSGSMTSMVSGGSIGAGIGCLIIDSLDPNIGWNEKLKRAGFTTVTTGMMGAAMKIPVVGILIS